MFPRWRNASVAAGDSLQLTCPLDTKNSCIIDFVEWYFSLSDPALGPSGRSLLRNAAVPFDPLIAYFPSMGPEQQGWSVKQASCACQLGPNFKQDLSLT